MLAQSPPFSSVDILRYTTLRDLIRTVHDFYLDKSSEQLTVIAFLYNDIWYQRPVEPFLRSCTSPAPICSDSEHSTSARTEEENTAQYYIDCWGCNTYERLTVSTSKFMRSQS